MGLGSWRKARRGMWAPALRAPVPPIAALVLLIPSMLAASPRSIAGLWAAHPQPLCSAAGQPGQQQGSWHNGLL